MKRGASELVAALVLAMIVLGALGWLMVQWQKGVGGAKTQVDVITAQAQVSAIKLDCAGNYLVGLDPTTPTVYDITQDPNLGNSTYCYTNLHLPKYTAYVAIWLTCNGQPLTYFIYGTFVQTEKDGVILYQFHPASSNAIVPYVGCTTFSLNPVAYFHIILPNGLEKLAVCFLNKTSTYWAVVSCTGV